jgi:hypothetical protein
MFQVKCLDAFTGQQTRLVVVVDALDSCEQDRVLIVLNAIHTLCSDHHSPFITILAIDPHIISKVSLHRLRFENLKMNFYFFVGCRSE